VVSGGKYSLLTSIDTPQEAQMAKEQVEHLIVLNMP
jgi:hypothetical protein